MPKILILLLACASTLSCAQPSDKPAPEAQSSESQGGPFTLYSAIEHKPLKYGEAVTVDKCMGQTCSGHTSDGKAFEVPRGYLLPNSPPVQIKYSLGEAPTYLSSRTTQATKHPLRPDQKVRIVEWDADAGRARIDDRRWVRLLDLRDHVETREERSQRTAAVRSAQASERQARIDYGAALREHYLDDSLDIKVTVSGQSADKITLRFALFNDVWAHKIQKGDLIDEIKAKGFKRLDMTDGFDYHVYWTFK